MFNKSFKFPTNRKTNIYCRIAKQPKIYGTKGRVIKMSKGKHKQNPSRHKGKHDSIKLR